MPQLSPESRVLKKRRKVSLWISPLHLIVNVLVSFLFPGTWEFYFILAMEGIQVTKFIVSCAFTALYQLSSLSRSSLQSCWTNSNSKVEERKQTQKTLTCTSFFHRTMQGGSILQDKPWKIHYTHCSRQLIDPWESRLITEVCLHSDSASAQD